MRNRFILLADLPLIAIAAFGAFALRFDWVFVRHRPEFLGFVLAVLILKPIVFSTFGLYNRYWRYATATDLLTVTLAVSAGRDRFAQILAAGLGIGIGLQAFIILGGTLRVIPLTGITAPFLSYGGSSMVTSFLVLGLLLHLWSERERI